MIFFYEILHKFSFIWIFYILSMHFQEKHFMEFHLNFMQVTQMFSSKFKQKLSNTPLKFHIKYSSSCPFAEH